MIKKSISIVGHKTSIALEKEFWEALDSILTEKRVNLPQFLIEIDEKRTIGLASSLRIYILNYYREKNK